MQDVFSEILGQPRVRDYLRNSTRSNCISHTLLFCGPAGSNKTSAAQILANAILCESGGGDNCQSCKRIKTKAHPDLHFYSPGGSNGYLVEQIREIISIASMSAYSAKNKVFILDRVDMLGSACANALLKTLEEPPLDTYFILLGRTKDGVLPTIVSRCQIVAFRYIPTAEAAGILSQNTGCDLKTATWCIAACAGSISSAIEFVKSNNSKKLRSLVLQTLGMLKRAQDSDIIKYSTDIITAAHLPLDSYKAQCAQEASESKDFLAASALRQLEKSQKRTLNARSMQYYGQIINIVQSWLRDLLMACENMNDYIINEDASNVILELSNFTNSAQVSQALQKAKNAQDAFTKGVSPELCVCAMLFEIREDLYSAGYSS